MGRGVPGTSLNPWRNRRRLWDYQGDSQRAPRWVLLRGRNGNLQDMRRPHGGEQVLGVNINDGDVQGPETVGDLASYIDQLSN